MNNNIIERVALLGVGLWLGIAASRTEWEPGAFPLYAASVTVILLGRWAVVRYRERRAVRHEAH